ncbi:MAG TPA: 23S rRNA (pseudouridine(1915)-N(3))-methyltransferase RlmH [Candidatus Aminicenantes bacterium]|nr:23S rRNA (pseudouridine(1915)-N(3))-methyltransferase RlmH [Candidatus Aminicenantes bacterium]HRY64047.1 23S rRNA (pseudouridine(1915)-N(3))-methyltransferase RlmH [Candidatus Aminicenantes bacterium]HRZ70960.1 23S rRNA (pseudouridine(1915)-N(3))-methyltransferase RlmH [Candidatus Aminicenantes bacterium]
MRLKFLWPGKTKNPDLRGLQGFYEARIRSFATVEIIETREARGLEEKHADKIRDLEARGLERHLDGAYVICLDDRGREMSSPEFARFLRGRERESGTPLVFVVGGFLGFADRIVERADLKLSLSRLTFSHELARVVLLEQVYRALTIVGGRHYAK